MAAIELYTPQGAEMVSGMTWALWAGVIMRLEHHLVGGYVRYISPHIIIIIIRCRLSVNSKLVKQPWKIWLTVSELSGKSSTGNYLITKLHNYDLKTYLMWSCGTIHREKLFCMTCCHFSEIIKCFTKIEMDHICDLFSTLKCMQTYLIFQYFLPFKSCLRVLKDQTMWILPIISLENIYTFNWLVILSSPDVNLVFCIEKSKKKFLSW